MTIVRSHQKSRRTGSALSAILQRARRFNISFDKAVSFSRIVHTQGRYVMQELKLNHLAIWILVIVHQIVAFVWYSPLLFGNQWMELLNKTAADFANPNPINYIIAIITAVVMTYLLGWLFIKLNVNTLLKGICYACIFFLCFLFLQTLTHGLFSFRPIGLTLIDDGMYLVNFVIAGAVLGSWKRHRK
jgi:hypothetical protein